VSETAAAVIRSTANPQFKSIRLLAQDSTAWRKQGRVWLEGDHLCRAALDKGVKPAMAVFAESHWERMRGAWPGLPGRLVLVADALMAGLSGLESPAPMGFVVDLPATPELDAEAPSLVLDRLQDAGNVGTLLRCAAAFGFGQVLAIKGTAALWSPKVLRAGMGAHFSLRLLEAQLPEVLDRLAVPLLATSSHGGEYLHRARLPWPCAWVLGHEGQGVSDEVAARAQQAVRIVQPGGEESLNVAAAGAICMHASAAAHAPMA
jgi:RNA methyltransferase, TrmH family